MGDSYSHANRHPGRASRSVGRGTTRILIVSDDSLARHLFTLMVEHPKSELFVVEHTERAVEVARHLQPHLTLFDTYRRKSTARRIDDHLLEE